MTDRVEAISQDAFLAAWDGSATLDEAARRVGDLAGKRVPRWAVLSRAYWLRAAGHAIKLLAPAPPEPPADAA